MPNIAENIRAIRENMAQAAKSAGPFYREKLHQSSQKYKI